MSSLYIVGLGAGNIDNLTIGALNKLQNNKVILRTRKHPCVEEFDNYNINFTSFDDIYDTSETFEEVYEKISQLILDECRKGDIVYAVPGNPLINETSVKNIIKKCEENNISYEIIEGISYIDVIACALKKDLGKGLELVDAFDILDNKFRLNKHLPVLINQVFNQAILSDVKLYLLDLYPDEKEVALIKNAGLVNEIIHWDKLYKIDRYEVDYLTTLYIPEEKEDLKEFSSLVKTVRDLRMPGGCPWDREQTHESLIRYIIEEAYEVIDAIENEDIDNLQEELGDLLFQILIHSQIADEENYFTVYDVIEDINKKMIRRHPHVFGDLETENVDVIFRNWDKIKATEKPKKSLSEEMESIPKHLPNLLIADKIQRKAGKVGFDWDAPEPAMEKVLEEYQEVLAELNKETLDMKHLEEEFGDLLFAVVNAVRLSDIDPNEALNKANRKFIKRFKLMEDLAQSRNLDMNLLSLDELEGLWVEAKNYKGNNNSA